MEIEGPRHFPSCARARGIVDGIKSSHPCVMDLLTWR